MLQAAVFDIAAAWPVAFGFGTLFGLWLSGRYVLVPRDRYESYARGVPRDRDEEDPPDDRPVP